MATLSGMMASMDGYSMSMTQMMGRTEIVMRKMTAQVQVFEMISDSVGNAGAAMEMAAGTTEVLDTSLMNVNSSAERAGTGLQAVTAGTEVLDTGLADVAARADEAGDGMRNTAAGTEVLDTGLSQVNASAQEAGSGMHKASLSAKFLDNGLERVRNRAKKVEAGFKKLVGAAFNMKTLKQGMEITDAYLNSGTRLQSINDNRQTKGDLQERIFEAANQSRSSYGDMVSAVTGMSLAGGSFTSNEEAIGFAELLQKSVSLSGAGASERQSAFSQVTHAMTEGSLQEGGLKSLMEQAPAVADAIAAYMGKSKGELLGLAAEGRVTSDVLKNAMFASADDINGRFAEMPMAFGDIGPLMVNDLLEAFGPAMEKISGILNSSGVQTLLSVFRSGIDAVAEGVNWLVDSLIEGGPVISAIFAGAIIMTGVWAGQMLIAAAAALMIHWPLLLIVAVLGAVIVGLTSMGVTFEEIFSFVGGLLGTFYAAGYNVVSHLWNIFVSFAEFIANVFQDPLGAAVNLFVNMATSALSVIESLAKAIDDVFGTSLAGAVSGYSARVQALGDSFKKDSYISLEDMRMETKDIVDTALVWSDKGADVGSFLDDWDFESILPAGGGNGGFDYNQFGTASNPATVKGTGAGGAVKVENEEDIEWMRTLAERDYVARIAQNTLAPNIKVEFSGPITREADTNRVMSHVVEQLKGVIAAAPEGVTA